MCEGSIEKSVPNITLASRCLQTDDIIRNIHVRVIVWHYEACRMMTNGDHKEWIFLSHSLTKIDFFSGSTLYISNIW